MSIVEADERVVPVQIGVTEGYDSDFHPYWIVFDRGHTEFFDDTGQEYHIRRYPHLFEDYWRLCQEFGLCIEDWREPKVDDRLIERFPALARYCGVPLAVIISLQYRS